MLLHLLLLLTLSLAGRAALSQDAFQTEASVGFGYAGSKTDEPLVAIDGLASLDYAFRGDASSRSLRVGSVRYLVAVSEDGATPFDLLPYVARVSAVSAQIGLTGTGLDSSGLRRQVDVLTESGSTGDRTTTDASLAGTIFARTDLALVVGLSSTSARETDVTSTRETPGGRVSSANLSPRSSAFEISLGIEKRLGEHAVSIAGRTRAVSAHRTDHLVFASGGSNVIESDLDGRDWGVALASRFLALSRRLVVDVSGSYDRTSSDLTAPVPIDAPLSIERAAALRGTFYPSRALGLSLGGSYGTRTDVSGLEERTRSAFVRTVSLSLGARFWLSSRASASLGVTRTTADAITPPGRDTFQQLLTTRVAVDLSAALRF